MTDMFEEHPRKVHFFHDQMGATYNSYGKPREYANTVCKGNYTGPVKTTHNPDRVTCKNCLKKMRPIKFAKKHSAQFPPTPSFLLITDKGENHHTIPMILFCPNGHRHIDEGDFAHHVHHTHACQECGIVWRPAKVNTHGVQFLPGYKGI